MSREVIIEEIKTDTLAERIGLKIGDRIISINNNKINDAIDLLFFGSESVLRIKIKRKDRIKEFEVERKEGEELGIVVSSFQIRRCKNRCIFCFVNQLPKGLRRSLYIKDDDFRLSFLHGNFITLTNLKDEDRSRIKQQCLSPLYISVHHTDRKKRNLLLGNPDAPDILKEIKSLADAKIKMHCQIVLCPGYNDGADLKKTIRDLIKLYPHVSSIAVVPVGLTRYNKSSLKPVEKEDALKAIEIIESIDRSFKKRYGRHIVHGADELYIKAGIPLPGVERYEGFPQIENGVGLVTQFLHKAKRLRPPKNPPKNRFVTFTGESFYNFLIPYVEQFKKEGINLELFQIKNRFFGDTVTVTGLLTGRDIIEALADKVEKGDYLLIPDVTTRDSGGENNSCGDEFLDGLTINDISKALSVKTLKIESSPEGLIKALEVLR